MLRAGDRAAWLYVCGLCYANEHLTDGFIPAEVLMVAAPGVKRPEVLAQKLAESGLWHIAEGGWQIHDYGDHQRTSTQVKETRRKDRERKARKESGDTFPADSARNPNGIQMDSERGGERNPSETYADARSLEKRREEEQPPTPFVADFEEWLLRYEQTTGHQPPARTTKAFKSIAESYNARRAEGHTNEDLLVAIEGAHADPWRREQGYDTADSILRPTKIGSLIAKGRLRSGGGRSAPKTSLDLAREIHGGAA